jgi:hypothetical protein
MAALEFSTPTIAAMLAAVEIIAFETDTTTGLWSFIAQSER